MRLAVFLAAVALSLAQTTFTEILGLVTDPTRAAVPGARVTTQILSNFRL